MLKTVSNFSHYNDFFLIREKKNNNAGFSGLLGTYGHFNIVSERKSLLSIKRVHAILRAHLAAGNLVIILARSLTVRIFLGRSLSGYTGIFVSPVWHLGVFSNNATFLAFLKRSNYAIAPKLQNILAVVYAPYHSRLYMVKELSTKGIPSISFVGAPTQGWTSAVAQYQVVANTGSKKLIIRVLVDVIKKAASTLL